MRVSSIVLEVSVGLLLGPSVIGIIPKELSVCYESQIRDCTGRPDQLNIADKGNEYCDLDAYMKAGLYASPWDKGFHKSGTASKVTLHGKVYCLDPSDTSCNRRLEDASEPRRLAGNKLWDGTVVDKKGKTDFDNYDACLKAGCELDTALKCATTPDIFTLVGHTGVGMMIFESGMHFDFSQAKTVGPWACAVAVFGTFLPLGAGCGLSMAYGFPFFPDGLSAGISLAPTSVGIALKLLHEAHALQNYFGQAVMTAAFVDDVLSLILFSVLFSLGGEMSFMTFLPLITGCVFMVVAIIAAVVVFPPFMEKLFSIVPEKRAGHKVTTHDQVMWILMFATLCIYGQITHLCGTHLWGCFIAGMCFSTNHHAHFVWVKQVKRMTCWWLRIFFACTLAWSIPVNDLFSLEAFWKGSIMGIGPCILTKVICAPFMGSARWVIGWAMVGRAEFAYFIAIMAKSLKMIDDKLFAILIWSLLYATIFAPLIFRKVLARFMMRNSQQSPEVIAAAASHNHVYSDEGHLPVFEAEEHEVQRQISKISHEKHLHQLEDAEHDIERKESEMKEMNNSLVSAQNKITELIAQMEIAKQDMQKQVGRASQMQQNAVQAKEEASGKEIINYGLTTEPNTATI